MKKIYKITFNRCTNGSRDTVCKKAAPSDPDKYLHVEDGSLFIALEDLYDEGLAELGKYGGGISSIEEMGIFWEPEEQ